MQRCWEPFVSPPAPPCRKGVSDALALSVPARHPLSAEDTVVVSVQEQIRKDVLLKGRLNWSKVEWHFFPSSRSDSLGPTKELMEALRDNGIGWVIHLP